MPSGAIMLTRSVRRGVEKLDFEQDGTGWRVVLERQGGKERDMPKEAVRQYATPDEAWKDVSTYVREGFRIVLCNE